MAGLALLWLARLGKIVCSVAAGTPVAGAELGLGFGLAYALVLSALAVQPATFAVVGMAALFTAIVRAPTTAIVLVTETTADAGLLLPMIVACFAALIVPALSGNRPILKALKARRYPQVALANPSGR